MVFEAVIGKGLDLRASGGEKVFLQPYIRVTDVFRNQGYQDLPPAAIVELSREQVEEHEKGGLAAAGEDDVFRMDRPAILLVEEIPERLDKFFVAPGGIIIGDELADHHGI